jgi:hypothetical protein
MNWKRLLTSPPPTTGWLFDSGSVAVVRRDSKGLLHCAATELGAGVIEVGPVGLQSVDRQRLAEHLQMVQGQIDGARRAAVVVPTGWVRAHLLEFEELPRRELDLVEVVRWRLKKLLPVLPSELRVAVVPQPAYQGRRHLLCMAGLEKALAELEHAFEDVGIEPGLVTPRVFALAAGSFQVPGPWLVIQQEAEFVSLLLLVDGAPRLLRTKPLPAAGDHWQLVIRELHMAMVYIREHLGVEGPLRVSVSAARPELDEALRGWWGDREGAVLEPAPEGMAFSEPGVVERLGAARLAPVHAVLAGGKG